LQLSIFILGILFSSIAFSNQSFIDNPKPEFGNFSATIIATLSLFKLCSAANS